MDAEHRERHDPATCRICQPIHSEAFRRGAARASRHDGVLPLSSAGDDARPGRDGYELPDG